MNKKKLMKTCMSLLLASSLMMGLSSGVLADNEPGGRGRETIQQSLQEENPVISVPGSGLGSEPGEEAEIEKELVSEEEAIADTECAESFQNTKDTLENSSASIKEDASDSEILPGDESPTSTPYSEILSDDNLVLVTVEQNGGPASEEVAVESVEELSETELDALEEYIEDQGYAVTRAAMLAAAPTVEIRTITFNMNGFISLEAEGFGSGYDAMFYVDDANYKGNGNAYCIDPSKQAPGHDQQGVQISYTTTVRDYTDSMLVKILYYGFGGLGDITDSHATGGPARHILTHMVATRRAAELGIPGAGDYTYRANQNAISKADTLYDAISAMPDITGRVSVLTPVSDHQTIMLLADYSIPPVEEEPALTELTVKKIVSGTGGNKNTVFHFELVITDPSGKTEKKTFTLQHGQEETFKDLPVGNTYTVTELDGETLGYEVVSEHASGTLDENPVEVTFTNTKEMIVPTGVNVNTGAMEGLLVTAMAIMLLIFHLRKQKNSTE